MIKFIKIVPIDQPNADGEWFKIDAPDELTKGWTALAKQLEPFVPEGHVLVSVSRDPPEGVAFDE